MSGKHTYALEISVVSGCWFDGWKETCRIPTRGRNPAGAVGAK